ncbi:MAG: hypothetical protein IPM54_01875 [Polyangiaceae bacterium]|nr:hypothetical protein [Polyangiaceae bacterium]
MSLDERDPLLDKLHALPVQTLDPARSARALRAAEEALPGKVRPGTRWPEFAIAVALSLTGVFYAVNSVSRLEQIYVSNQAAPSSLER